MRVNFMIILELNITAPGDGTGYVGRMFRALFDAKVNIELITTSDIRSTCLIEESQVPKAVRALHKC